MRLCHCGAIVEKRCLKCHPFPVAKRTTTERGYGWDHRQASERYRALHPLCEACVMERGVMGAKGTDAMHHIHKISDRPDLRMVSGNWLAVCNEHHDLLENDWVAGTRVKEWSERHYLEALDGGS